MDLCSRNKCSNFRTCNFCVSVISYINYLCYLYYYVGIQTDIDEGGFVSKAPVVPVEDIHSNAIVKVFIVLKYFQ